jgi:protein-S-isoprenylcysteine O-methyltransferase Ste14
MERKRKIIPPVYLMLTLLAMGVLHSYWPLVRFIEQPYTSLGVLPLAAGLFFTGHAARMFKRAGTPLVPFERSTTLITTGLYRITRNPMYVGLFAITLGVAVLLGTLGAFLPIPVFVWIIHTQFVVGEERFLESLFGADYLAYKRSVRRWL